jgi:hypothetical protein
MGMPCGISACLVNTLSIAMTEVARPEWVYGIVDPGDALERNGHRVTRIDMDRDLAAKLVETKPDLHDATAGHGDAVWHQRLLGQYLVDRDDRGGEARATASPGSTWTAIWRPSWSKPSPISSSTRCTVRPARTARCRGCST